MTQQKERRTDQLKLVVENPHYKGTELRADIQVWKKGEPKDKLEYEKLRARLQYTPERERIETELTQLGIGNAGQELDRKISEAVKLLEERRNNFYSKWADQDKARMAIEMIEELSPGSRWINSPDGLYWMNGTNDRPIRINGREMDRVLWDRFKVNRAQRSADYYVNAMEYHAANQGESVDLHEFAVYQPQENRLVVDTGSGDVAVLDGRRIDYERNGACGVLFKPMRFQEPFVYDKDHAWLLDDLIGSIAFADTDASPLTADDQRLLYKLYMGALFFGAVMPQKPIAIAVGETESGKSTMFRLIGRILAGPEWDLKVADDEKPGDFWTAVTSNVISAWDNVDRGVRWLQDALCVASDGVPIVKRILHTTNEEGVYKPKCFIQITARTPNFRRKDVSTRGLVFHTRLRERKRAAYELFQEINDNRGHLMSELLDMVNDALAIPVQDASDSPIRNADFWAICKRIALGLDLDMDRVKAAFARLKQAQDGFAAEENGIVLSALEWLDGLGPGGVYNTAREVTTSALYKELGEIAEKAGFRFPRNSIQFGRELQELARGGGLDSYFKFEDLGPKGGRGRVVKLTRLEDQVEDLPGRMV